MKHFSVSIGIGENPILFVPEFTLGERKLQFLFGESGIGKSLLAKTIFGVPDPCDWTIRINHKPYEEYRKTEEFRAVRKNGYFVFQEPSTHYHPLDTIAGQLQFYDRCHDPFRLEIYRSFFSEEEWYRLVLLYPTPHRPSGGEKQRMFLIRAFLKIREWQLDRSDEPALFVFDEPMAHLDSYYRNIFYDLLIHLFRQKPFSTLIISHDYSVILRFQRFYADVLKDCIYDELFRDETGVNVRTFEAEQFIQWHAHVEPLAFPSAPEPMLSVPSGVKIFKRVYGFARYSGQPETLTVPRSSMVYLKAPSGFGKTLMVKSLMGLIPSASFQMRVNGIRISAPMPERFWAKKIWGRRMSMVFQHADETLNPDAPAIAHFRGLPLKRKLSDEEIARQFSQWFHEPLSLQRLQQPVKTFSGGQKQRMALFRAMLLEPDLLILDEPFNGLDFHSLRRVLQTLTERIRNGTSMILISHDEELVQSFVPKEGLYHLLRLE